MNNNNNTKGFIFREGPDELKRVRSYCHARHVKVRREEEGKKKGKWNRLLENMQTHLGVLEHIVQVGVWVEGCRRSIERLRRLPRCHICEAPLHL